MFRSNPWAAAVGAFSLLAACGSAAATAPTAPATRFPMQEYALIFRATRPVDPALLPTRNAAARDWALALRDQGRLHAASPLEAAGHIVSEHGVTSVSTSASVASVLIVRGTSLQEVVKLAQHHPGLAYGTEIEVRPVKNVSLER